MILSLEYLIMLLAGIISLFLLIFAIDWRYFRDWIVVFLYKCVLDFCWGGPVQHLHLLEYPVRLLPHYYETSIFFELWVFPILCVFYNQITRQRGLWPIIYYALLFSAVMTAIEYPLELYTDLIKYLKWSWFTTFYTLILSFLSSRAFIAFYRWGCNYYRYK